MKMITTQEEFEKLKYRENVHFECKVCKSLFSRPKRRIIDMRREGKENIDYCGNSCRGKFEKLGKIFICPYCGKENYRQLTIIKRSKTDLFFCSISCGANYYHSSGKKTYKRKGSVRSKLEIWIENKLNELYPILEIKYNDRQTINAELDICIPSLKLAFELNGPFHYEPIFGQEKLDKTQNNDKRKFQACIEHKISLCIIDTSKHIYLKEKFCLPYLKIITDIINQKISQSSNDRLQSSTVG